MPKQYRACHQSPSGIPRPDRHKDGGEKCHPYQINAGRSGAQALQWIAGSQTTGQHNGKMKRNHQILWLWLVCGGLVAATLATYWSALRNDFINYDDPDYVTANHVVQEGVTWKGIEWAFTTGHASNWHPLTWLSHMLDITWFGLEPQGHHLTNLLLHCVNTLLLLLLLWYMTGALWRSALVAALFALHPLHVESVAWVAERKDLLSALFGLLTLWAYARYVQATNTSSPSVGSHGNPKPKLWYGMSLGFFAGGLMSKPMLVTWPFVMLLLDFWPLRRLDLAAGVFGLGFWRRHQKLVWEKLPFFVLTILSSSITLIVQHGAMAKTELVGAGDRVGNAILAYSNYLQQTIWPAKLAVFYPFPIKIPVVELVIVLVVLIIISILAIRLARSQPFVLIGWLWFLGTLVPVIGLVQVGAQARADRYTYLPLVGIFFALVWGFSELVKKQPWLKKAGAIAALAVLTALGVTSHAQLQHWRNDRTLCAHAARVTTGNYMAWGGLGIVDAKAGNWSSAMTNLMRAYEYAKIHHTERSVSYYIGVALQMQGKPKEALSYFQDCVVSAEMRPELDHRLGLSLMDAGRLAEAEPHIKAAVAAKPHSLDYNLGMAALLVTKDDLQQAEPIYTNAVEKHPKEPLALKSYGEFLILVNRLAEAEPWLAKAVSLKPENPAYRKAYATLLQRNGKLSLAAEQLESAAKLATPSTQELLNLAELHTQLKQPHQALDYYNRALTAEPNSLLVLNNYAWALATSPDATLRNGPRAVELGERACRISQWKIPVLIGTLAAAYAEAGRFADAVTTADKAIAVAHETQQTDAAKRNVELRKLYQNGKPYRDE